MDNREQFEFEKAVWRIVWMFANQALRYHNREQVRVFLAMSREKPWRGHG